MYRNKHKEAVKIQRQRNMSQIKEQNKTPEKELNKMETSNLPDAKFKTLVKKLLKELSGNLNHIKKIQSEMKPYTKMKVNLQGINCRVGEAENQISDLEYKEAKNTQSEQQEEKESKNIRIV